MSLLLTLALSALTGLRDALSIAGKWLTANPARLVIALLIAICAFLCWRLASVDGDRDGWRTKSAAIQRAFDGTVANYRAAAVEAERVQSANLARVKSEQEQINAEVLSDYQRRLADARSLLASRAKANPGGTSQASVPGPGTSAGGIDEAPRDVLSDAERLIAAEQAIQLDELITWVERQAAVTTSPAQ